MTIEEYLAALRRELRVGPLRRRRIVRELDAHLHDAVRTLEGSGLEYAEAERLAIERLGAVGDVSASFRAACRPRRLPLAVGAGAVLAAGVVLLVVWLARSSSDAARRAAPPKGAAKIVPTRSGRTVVWSVSSSDRTRPTVTITASDGHGRTLGAFTCSGSEAGTSAVIFGAGKALATVTCPQVLRPGAPVIVETKREAAA